MPNARTFLENLLAQGELETAIRGSLLLCRHYGDSEGGSAAAQLSARYHALIAQQRDGTISQEEYRLERARINRAMLDGAQKMPADWTAEPLVAAGFSAHAPAAAQRKGFLEKWGLVLGLVALVSIAGIVFFPKKGSPVEQPSGAQPAGTSTAALPSGQPAQQQPPTRQPADKPAPVQERKPNNSEGATSTKPRVQVPPSVPQPDSRFRSFAKTVISDGMERGKVGSKMAFRNVKTGETLCCYADAEDFADGKANVSQDGVTYFFINKKGERVK